MAVRVNHMELEGFGLYKERTVFTFQPGLNTFVAANESGKSTLLAGLLATLFGLPNTTDPNEWSTARYRCWSHPLHFRGELHLQDEDRRHHLRRDFATHKVLWLATTPGKDDTWETLFDDEHNPAARGSAKKQYQKLLQDLLGLDDLTLFHLTYCLTQDPEDRSDEEADFRSKQVPDAIRGLISGSGRQVEEVLGTLFDQFAGITKATRDAGLIRPGKTRASNQRQDGRLETTRARQEEVRRSLEESRSALDELHGAQEELDELREAISRGEQELLREDRLRKAWDGWMRAREDKRTFSEQIVKLEKALTTARAEERQGTAAEAELTARYPEFAAADLQIDVVRARLSELTQVAEDLTAQRQERAALQQRREGLEKDLAAARESIVRDGGAFAERPHLPRDHEQWRRVAAELSDLNAELGEIDEQLAEARARTEKLEHWARLDPEADPARGTIRAEAQLRKLETEIPHLLERVAEARTLQAERAQLGEQLAGPLAAIENLPDQVRKDAANFDDRRQLFEREARAARGHFDDLQKRKDEQAGRRQEILTLEKQIVGQIGADGPDNDWNGVCERLEKKAHLLEEESGLLRRVDRVGEELRAGLARQVGVPAILAFVLGGIVGAVIANLTLPEGVGRYFLVASVALIAGGGAGLISYRSGQGTQRDELSEARTQLVATRKSLLQLNRQLTEAEATGRLKRSPSKLDLMELTLLCTQIRAYRLENEELKSQEVLAPGEEEYKEAHEALVQAGRDLMAFEESMASLGSDPQEKIELWQHARERLATIDARLDELSSQLGTNEWDSAELAGLSPAWDGAIRLARVRARLTSSARPENGAQLLALLEGIDPDDWAAWRQEASRLAEAAQALHRLELQRESLLRAADGEDSRIDALTARAAELAEACAPYTLETPPEDLKKAAEDFRQLDEKRREMQTRLDEITEAERKSDRSIEEHQTAEARVREDLAPILTAADDSAEKAAKRLKEAATLHRRRSDVQERFTAILASWDAADLQALEVKVEDLRADNQRLAGSIRELEDAHPLLCELASADPEEIQRRHTDFRTRYDEAGEQLDRLVQKRDTLLHRTADAKAEGRRVGNVAVLEMEAEQLQAEERKLLEERDALRIAFLTLREAETDYGHTHRERLQDRASEIFRRISRTPDRSITLDERFGIQVITAGNQPCVARQLSQGARDQLALAMRLAVAELLAEGALPPLLLDDPFLAFDAPRLDAMRQALLQLAEDRQIILLSHREGLADWGDPVGRATT